MNIAKILEGSTHLAMPHHSAYLRQVFTIVGGGANIEPDLLKERDSLKSANSNLEKTKRENSSTISDLTNELRKKSDKIVELNKQLSTLENSDPILKEARRIQSLNMRKEEDLAEREKNVRKAEKDTGEKLKNAEKYESEQKKILDDMNAQVDARAELKILGI